MQWSRREFLAMLAASPALALARATGLRLQRPPPLQAGRLSFGLEQQFFFKDDTPTAMRECLPESLDSILLEYYLLSSIGSDTVLFLQQKTPLAAYTLEGQARKRWESAREERKASVTAEEARRVTARICAEMRVPRRDVEWRIGYKDLLEQGVRRYAPYAPYFFRIAAAQGIDGRLGVMTLQESNFQVRAVSGAGCEGPWQLSRIVARGYGLVVPRQGRGQVNESNHPLLAAYAATALVRRYAFLTGSLLTGISAYHTGPGNIAAMRALALRYGPQVRKVPDLVPRFERYFQSHGIAASFPTPPQYPLPLYHVSMEGTAGRALQDYVSIINGIWRLPQNKTTFKAVSARYVARVLALAALVEETAEPFAADCIRVEYAGKRRINQKRIAAMFPSAKETDASNPHLPHGVSIPSRTRVFLPPGASESFFARNPELAMTTPVLYRDGTITPLTVHGPVEEPDRRYASLVEERFHGRYASVTAEDVERLRDEFSQLASIVPSAFRAEQFSIASQDRKFYDEPAYRTLLKVAQGRG